MMAPTSRFGLRPADKVPGPGASPLLDCEAAACHLHPSIHLSMLSFTIRPRRHPVGARSWARLKEMKGKSGFACFLA